MDPTSHDHNLLKVGNYNYPIKKPTPTLQLIKEECTCRRERQMQTRACTNPQTRQTPPHYLLLRVFSKLRTDRYPPRGHDKGRDDIFTWSQFLYITVYTLHNKSNSGKTTNISVHMLPLYKIVWKTESSRKNRFRRGHTKIQTHPQRADNLLFIPFLFLMAAVE